MNRPNTSQMVIDLFTKIIDSQDDKGFEKYGVSIDEANDVDYKWPIMALEEAADLQKYLVKEILKLDINNQFLLKELLEAKEIIRNLKEKTRFSKYEELEKQNLAMAEEIKLLNFELKTHHIFIKE